MLREQEESLWAFCARQRDDFDPGEWLKFERVPRVDLALAAAFLAMQDEYGHSGSLAQVAEVLYPGTMAAFSERVAQRCFDLSRFDHMLKAELAAL